MHIVIDIPEKIYEASQILDVKHEDTIQIPLEVIANGTPLPKGHGRLIDVDEIAGDGSWDFADRLDETPTIIEADKESEEKEE